MDFRQLRYFSVVAETRHFGQASEQLHVTPSAISQAIRQLEAEFGVVLLNRSTRHVEVTAAGRWLKAEAEQILGRLDEATTGIRRFSAGSAGLLRLGLTGVAAFAYLPRIARAMKRQLPDVALSIHADMLTPEQCEGLTSGSLDLGFLRPPAVGRGLATAPFVTEPLLLALPSGHRLATAPEIHIADLADEPWVAYSDQHSLLNEAATRMCRRAGFEPRREHVCAGTAVLLALVSGGMGIAVVPGGVRAFPMVGIVFRPLAEAEHLEIVIAYRADNDDPGVRAAIRVLTSASTNTRANPSAAPEPVATAQEAPRPGR